MSIKMYYHNLESVIKNLDLFEKYIIIETLKPGKNRCVYKVYDTLSKTSSITPSKNDILEFYNNVKYLKNVTDTDDMDYWNYISKLKQYIIKYNY